MNIHSHFSTGWLASLAALTLLLAAPSSGEALQERDVSSQPLAAKQEVQETSERQVRIHIDDGPSLRISLKDLSFSHIFEGLKRLDRVSPQLEGHLEDFDRDLKLVLRGQHQIPTTDTIRGNVLLLGGDLEVAGHIEGDLLVLGGRTLLDSTARLEGELVSVGGTVEQRSGASVGGATTRLDGEEVEQHRSEFADDFGDQLEEDLEEELEGNFALHLDEPRGFWGRLAHGVGGILQLFFTGLLIFGVGALMIYFTPERMATSSRTLRHHFGRSFLVGLLGEFLVLPLLLVLTVMIVTIPVIPFFLLAVLLLGLAAKPVMAHMVGRWFVHRPSRPAWVDTTFRRSPYHYLAAGIGVFLALPVLAKLIWIAGGFLGGLALLIVSLFMGVLWVFHTAGFGALLLSRLGGDTRWTSPGRPQARRSPAGGSAASRSHTAPEAEKHKPSQEDPGGV